MSEVVIVAAMGPAARNSGALKYVDVLAELHDNGIWRFRALGARPGAGGDERELMLPSCGAYADEIAAGFAVAIDHNGARARVADAGAATGSHDDVEIVGGVIADLASLVAEIDVAVVVTDLGSEPLSAEAFPAVWSVITARPVGDARRSQWDAAASTDRGEG